MSHPFSVGSTFKAIKTGRHYTVLKRVLKTYVLFSHREQSPLGYDILEPEYFELAIPKEYT